LKKIKKYSLSEMESILDKIENETIHSNPKQNSNQMTITTFDATAFNGKETVIYDGKEYPLISVDFKEKLIGINEFPDDEDDEHISWKRCENCEIKMGTKK